MEDRKDLRHELGRLGEELVCGFLREKGHTVMERNWRCGHLEIDIITIDPDGIHFVEVKTRRSGIQAPPQDNVDKGKQKRIAKAAQKFLKTAKGLPHGDLECQFDVAAVTFKGEEAEIELIEQAYIPIYI